MTVQDTYPIYLANKPIMPNTDLAVEDKYTGEVVTRVPSAGPELVEQAIAAAVTATRPMAKLPAYKRQAALQHCVERFIQTRDDLAEVLCIEAGKPIKDARGEVTRLIETFKIAAEEATRIVGNGQVMELAISERARAYRGMWKRVPIGPVSLITPFNFPLNLVAHKVAPAIAAGCPFVLKPARNTPIGALMIGSALAETDLPEGAFSIITPSNEDSAPLVEDDRLKLLSFTGSLIGWKLKAKAGKKKVVLELGGNAACIVDETIAGNHLDDAVDRMVIGAFYQSGQSCIGVQRILLHASIYDDFKAKFIAKTVKLKAGDPKEEDTFVGPMIDQAAAERVESWIAEAVADGAKLLCGGKREGAIVTAAVLEDVPRDAKVSCQEVFGPVVLLRKFNSFDEALSMADDSDFGLQTGVFTRDLYRAQRAWDELDVGGVVVGDVPSWRVDHMPYGGVKDSGLGREGLTWAIEDMTELRLLVIRDPEHAE